MRPPRVSIGLPVYNGAPYLGVALDSLLAQTYSAFDLILSDNASTDETPAICQAYARRDPRIRYYRSEKNRGAAWNYNRVAELADGEYFKWAAHDDVCDPRLLERCTSVLEDRPEVVLCYPKSILIDQAGQPVRPCTDECGLASRRPSERFRHLLENLRLSNPMYGVIRTRVLRTIHPMGRYPAADINMLSEIALRGQLYELPESLFLRRDHPGKSDRANAKPGALAAWYDPANQDRIVLRDWTVFLVHLRSIARVPMSVNERAACYAYMARQFRWSLPSLSGELLSASRTLLRRIGRYPHASRP